MRKLLAILLLAVMMVGLCACGAPEKAIVGTWKSQSSVLGIVTETTYTFHDDGTGTKSSVLNVSFTYAFEDDQLLITTSALGMESTEKYSFDFNGDRLVLTGENETIDLQRVK